MALRGGESSIRDNQNDTLSNSSATPFYTGAAIAADELSKVADVINWWRMPEQIAFEAMADQTTILGYYGEDELMDTSAAGDKPG